MDVPESILMKASTSQHEVTGEASSSQMMDKFMERLISMALPLPSSVSSTSGAMDATVLARAEMQKTRPPLSIPVMSRNSILLLQRLSVPFEVIDTCIKLINWVDPLWNITLGLVLTLAVLKPINFVTLPLAYVCFQVILPAYCAKTEGKWTEPKPVSQFSREFLLNVTDLQNHMLLYVDTWDYLLRVAKRTVFFVDERLTWLVFVTLVATIGVLEAFGTSILWFFGPFFKLVAVIVLWIALVSLHPQLRLKFLTRIHDEELRLRTLSLLNKLDDVLVKDVELDLTPERTLKLFAIFELQVWNATLGTWQFGCFSNDAYPINSHVRKNNIGFKGAELLSSIVPPSGFQWTNGACEDPDSSFHIINSDVGKLAKTKRRRRRTESKRKLKPFLRDGGSLGIHREGWALDLDPALWVQDAIVGSVVTIDEETKWVYDEENASMRIRRRRWLRLAQDDKGLESETEDEDETKPDSTPTDENAQK